MKKLLLVLSFFMFSGIAAAEVQTEVSLEENSTMVSPCRYWRYDAGTGGSTCSSIAHNIQIPEARDLDYKFRQLEERIRRLEGQIKNNNN